MNDHIPAEDFAAYVDGMLGPEVKNEVERHFSQCPACLDELLEIADIMDSRETIPTEFLKLALGEKSKTFKSVLHLRFVFEIAAVLVVAVFIGYFFLSNNRFWQSPEEQKPSFVMEKNISPADTSSVDSTGKMALLPAKQRERTDAGKANNEQTKADADQRFADSLVSEKRKSVVGDKGVSAEKPAYVQIPAHENKLNEITEEKPRPAIEKENLEKKELTRTAAVPEIVGAVQFDFVAKDKTAARVMGKKAGEAEQNLEAQKEPGAGVATPIEANVKKSKLKDEESTLRSPVAVPEFAGADKQALEDKKQDAALTRKEIAGRKTLPPISIDGEAVWSDLLNPELFIAWSWFQKGLTLELQIDTAGTVTAVVPLGKFDQPLARQAESEAKKLIFSVSKKKSRRARLIANEKPPNPR